MVRVPTRRHWEIWESYQSLQMTPEEFLFLWDVSREELAKLCGKSLSTVNHWFSRGAHRIEPSEDDQRRLAEIHAFWTQFENEPKHLREIFEAKPRRRHQK